MRTIRARMAAAPAGQVATAAAAAETMKRVKTPTAGKAATTDRVAMAITAETTRMPRGPLVVAPGAVATMKAVNLRAGPAVAGGRATTAPTAARVVIAAVPALVVVMAVATRGRAAAPAQAVPVATAAMTTILTAMAAAVAAAPGRTAVPGLVLAAAVIVTTIGAVMAALVETVTAPLPEEEETAMEVAVKAAAAATATMGATRTSSQTMGGISTRYLSFAAALKSNPTNFSWDDERD